MVHPDAQAARIRMLAAAPQTPGCLEITTISTTGAHLILVSGCPAHEHPDANTAHGQFKLATNADVDHTEIHACVLASGCATAAHPDAQ